MTLEEERARNEAREEIKVQMQIVNEHFAALCGSECLKAFFPLHDFCCIFFVAGSKDTLLSKIYGSNQSFKGPICRFVR